MLLYKNNLILHPGLNRDIQLKANLLFANIIEIS